MATTNMGTETARIEGYRLNVKCFDCKCRRNTLKSCKRRIEAQGSDNDSSSGSSRSPTRNI